MALAHTAFENRLLVDLAIVAARLFLKQVFAPTFCVEDVSNAESVRAMRLWQARDDALVFGQIPAGIRDRQFGMALAQAVEHRPTHDAHESLCPERSAAPGTELLQLACVIRLVARLAQRDEVARRVASRFPTLNVMHVENQIFRSAFAGLANVTVAEQHIFAHVPKAKLLALLIAFAFNLRVFDLLNVEGCGFNHDFGDRKHSANRFNARYVRLNAVFNGRRKPALVL